MDPVESMRRRAAEIGCTLEEVWEMTVAEFLRRVAEHRAKTWPKRWTTYEMFGFKDGARYAWITWQLDDALAERRCVAVSEEARPESEWSRNVQAHCRSAADNSIATLRALGKSPSRVQRAVGR